MLPLHRRQSTEPNCCALQWGRDFICQDNIIFIMESLHSENCIFLYKTVQAVDVATISDKLLFWGRGFDGSSDSTVLSVLTLPEGLFI